MAMPLAFEHKSSRETKIAAWSEELLRVVDVGSVACMAYRLQEEQRPQKTSRTSSKPPSTDRKEQRERSKPGGAKPGHEGHSRILSATPDEVVEHRPDRCSCCSAVLMADLAGGDDQPPRAD